VGHDFCITAVDLQNESNSTVWLDLLDHYACDPMDGGEGLSAYARTHLVDELKRLPIFRGALAWRGEKPVGLINCFTGFSTFAAKPLLNINDIVVHADARRQGVGQALLQWAERRARQFGRCKLTLEILSSITRAMAAYARAGCAPCVLDPASGHALLMQKLLPDL
jgi:GNAT superfamily N-acetyltransferase